MDWRLRIGIFAGGIFIIFYGLGIVELGVFDYLNSKGQRVYAPGVVGVGALIALLAFLPPSKWFYSRISTKGKNRQR